MLRRKGPEQKFAVASVVTERNACRDETCVLVFCPELLWLQRMFLFCFTGGIPSVNELVILLFSSFGHAAGYHRKDTIASYRNRVVDPC